MIREGERGWTESGWGDGESISRGRGRKIRTVRERGREMMDG